jgi:hypothetical protein
VGVDQSVLSMVFSGKRPLPTSIAKEFLGLLGMHTDNTFDINHAFVFVEKRSNDATLNELLVRMYPEKPGIVWLRHKRNGSEDQSNAAGSGDIWALFDGRIACVIHGNGGAVTQAWKGTEVSTLKDFDSSPKLLLTKDLPEKIDVLKAFAKSKFPVQANWEDVSQAALRKNLTAYDVLQMISAHN